MADAPTNDVTAVFEVEGVSDTLHLLHLSGREAISEMFEFQLELAAESDELDLDEITGKPALITISGEGEPRYVHGMVNALEQGERVRGYTSYYATVVPALWRLLHRQDCRVFQQLSAEQIVQQVLEAAGVPLETYQIKLEGNKPTPKQEYCVHFRESDWGFISRILESSGFYYFFQHDAERCLLVMGNNYQFHPPVPGQVQVQYHEPSPTLPAGECITSLTRRRTICPSVVTLNDFNPLTPSVNLQTRHSDGGQAELEIYDYPGVHRTPAEGDRRAAMRLQEARSQRQVIRGASDCLRLIPGHYFTLTGYGREDLNGQDLLVAEAHHLCEKHQDLGAGALEQRVRYSNELSCIPRKVPFRPAQRTPKPSVRGVQTAIVVGPPGEEIYTDKYGRVKVQFHWDRQGKRDEGSSCWIRVSQGSASQGWGSIFLPRVGDEVIVDFIDGDPDRPIITGRVYHAQNMPPYTLPAEKSKSTIKTNSTPGGGGYNEIRLEDKKGAEEFYTHAQRDQNERVKRNMSTTVGADQSVTVQGQRTVKVSKDEQVSITGNQHTEATSMTMVAKSAFNVLVGSSGKPGVATNNLVLTEDYVTVWNSEGVRLVVGSDYIKLKAPRIELDGDDVIIKGGSVDIKSTGATDIKGTPIKLNCR